MTDRELLELAAKAAGIRGNCHEVRGRLLVAEVEPVRISDDTFGFPSPPWSPLTHDADALRLAVKLRIGLDHNRAGDQQRYVAADRPGCEGCFSPVCCVEEFEDESQRDAATRRAIVRAAAEIGRSVPGGQNP